MELKHHNSQRHYYVDGGIYLPAGRQVSVTCKTLNNYPFFREQVFCDFNPLTPSVGRTPQPPLSWGQPPSPLVRGNFSFCFSGGGVPLIRGR